MCTAEMHRFQKKSTRSGAWPGMGLGNVCLTWIFQNSSTTKLARWRYCGGRQRRVLKRQFANAVDDEAERRELAAACGSVINCGTVVVRVAP